MISTHVLDTSLGIPGAGVSVRLRRRENKSWTDVARGVTNKDGRYEFSGAAIAGCYQLIFEVEGYFKKTNRAVFFPRIPVVFTVDNSKAKYHVPLLLSPFGYSTYRGS
jgi:5-hydroxyisourate hydrolase